SQSSRQSLSSHSRRRCPHRNPRHRQRHRVAADLGRVGALTMVDTKVLPSLFTTVRAHDYTTLDGGLREGPTDAENKQAQPEYIGANVEGVRSAPEIGGATDERHRCSAQDPSIECIAMRSALVHLKVRRCLMN